MQKSDSSHMLEYVLGMMNWLWLICDNILEDETWKISRFRDMHCTSIYGLINYNNPDPIYMVTDASNHAIGGYYR